MDKVTELTNKFKSILLDMETCRSNVKVYFESPDEVRIIAKALMNYKENDMDLKEARDRLIEIYGYSTNIYDREALGKAIDLIDDNLNANSKDLPF